MATAKTPAKRVAKATTAKAASVAKAIKKTMAAVPTVTIGQHLPDLNATYVGIAGDIVGGEPGHLVRLDETPPGHLNRKDAAAWAEGLGNGARLPTKAEAALMITNDKKKAIKAGWYWTNEDYNASFAWTFCSHGSTYIGSKSAAGGALAVRRLPLQSFNPLGVVEA